MKKSICLWMGLMILGLLYTGCIPVRPIQVKPTDVTETRSQPTDTIPIQTEPESTPEQTAEILPLDGIVIGIDPGHQAHSNKELEPNAPGSAETKKKVSAGTKGTWSQVPEYAVNLDVALLLKGLLEQQGATVIMTRETNDVNISNSERANLFNENKTDYAIRLHCNGSDNQNLYGAFMLVPKENPYLEDCHRAADLLLNEYCKSTGAANQGITIRDDQTGFNWCQRMIICIEMGFMTNQQEDALLTDRAYQQKMAEGLARGILCYFGVSPDLIVSSQ